MQDFGLVITLLGGHLSQQTTRAMFTQISFGSKHARACVARDGKFAQVQSSNLLLPARFGLPPTARSPFKQLCSRAHGVCIIQEDGARIGAWPRDSALPASTFSIRSYVASGSSGATTPGPNGETVAGCVAPAQKIVSRLTHGYKNEQKTLCNCI